MHHGSWLALLPFLSVIPIAMWTKQVIPGLFVALLLGSFLKEPSLMGGIKEMLMLLVDNLVKSSNIRIIIFLYAFAGLVSMIKYAGGIKGFVHLVSKKIKSERGAMFLTWISTVGTFSDPDFRIVTVSPIMKVLKERLNLTSRQIGFAIEVTSNPVVGLIPIATAFVGYMVSVIAMALKTNDIHQKAYTVYVQSIPFNFYSFALLLIGIWLTFFRRSKKQAQDNKKVDPAKMEEEVLTACHRAYKKETPAKPWNLILPLALVLLLTLFLSWWDGRPKAKSFFDAFLHSDALGVMLESLLIGLLFTLVFFLFQRFSLTKLVQHFVEGGNELMSVIILLALIWGVSDVSEQLGFSDYITEHVKHWIPGMFVAPIIFLLGGLISYFIGSSWGTWGLLMPLAVSLAHNTGGNILLVIGAVFASGTFGAFTSPLSDNTVTLCTILDLPVMSYSRTKLVPSLAAAGIATVLFGAAAFIFK